MKKVLVIEDNRENLDIISLALRRAGYDIISAGTGEEGIELSEQHIPFFIILDINLPGIDGLETARRLRGSDRSKDIPIVAITSYAMRGDRERILAAGCNAYFEKPIDPITIVEHIHEALGIRR